MLQPRVQPQARLAFLTLTVLELVLGIDNIIFIAILVDERSPAWRELARRIGLFLAMFLRIGLLSLLAWIIGLTPPLFMLVTDEFSGRDLILIAGGLCLLWKSTFEVTSCWWARKVTRRRVCTHRLAPRCSRSCWSTWYSH
jgi:predicted tellurium resistance membrane protein TerC